jgi:hypothetical protein
LSGSTVTGGDHISLHTFCTTNYELKIEMRLVSGKEAKLELRSYGGMWLRVVFKSSEIVADRHHVEQSKRKVFTRINTDGRKFHKLHVLSRGNLLRVVMDNEHVLMDLKNVPFQCRGFGIHTHEGEAAFRNAAGRFLR